MIKPADNSVVIKNSCGKYFFFSDPLQIITTQDSSEVKGKLQLIDSCRKEGYYAAGFVSYNAAVFSDNYFSSEKPDFPLLWFGIYKSVEEIDQVSNKNCFAEIIKWKPHITSAQYIADLKKIKNYLKQGDTYQINYTFPLYGKFDGEPWDFFSEFCTSPNIPYSAYIQTDTFCIASASPELFFHNKDNSLLFSPMKGTRPFSKNIVDENLLQKRLMESEKERAENLMIVDMIRNDAGKIAIKGSVKVPAIFSVRRYDSVIQMTSDIQAAVDEFSITEIFEAMFPCASITGAPKYSSMKIISSLESAERNIYTGSIGYLTPENECQFNVAIRTVLFNKISHTAVYGVGSGIVWDSEPAEEYKECFDKAKCVQAPAGNFDLFESVLYDSSENNFYLIDEHLNRLKASAETCSFVYPEKDLQDLLLNYSAYTDKKVKFILSRNGKIKVEEHNIKSPTKYNKVRIADKIVNSRNFYLYHKTTNKHLIYNDLSKGYSQYYDLIFINERGEITESTIANIVIEKDGQRYTPPVESGLLPGTFRAHLLKRGLIREKVLLPEDLCGADRIFLINSVRKWVEVSLDDQNLNLRDVSAE